MAILTLRELARSYADGIIQLEQYQKDRGALISGIIDGTIELKEIDYLPILDPDSEKRSREDLTYDEDKDEAKTEIRSLKKQKPATNNDTNTSGLTTTGTTADAITADAGPTTPSPIDSFRIKPLEDNKSNTTLFIGLGVAATILLAIGIFFMTKDKPEEMAVQQEVQVEENIPVQKPGKQGAELVRQFVAKKRWNDSSMNSFLDEWSTLSDLERRATLESGTITQMTNAIFQQFKQEQVLASIGDPNLALQKQQKLIDFAKNVGIEDTRLVIANTAP